MYIWSNSASHNRECEEDGLSHSRWLHTHGGVLEQVMVTRYTVRSLLHSQVETELHMV